MLCTYIMEVAREDAFLQRSHKDLQELQVKRVQSHLSHVDVTCWYRLVSALQTIIVISAIGPFTICFHNGHQIITERIGHNREPVDIRTWLLNHCGLIQLCRVVLMYVLCHPIVAVAQHSVEIGTSYCAVEVVHVDQVTEIALIADVHEDTLYQMQNRVEQH